MLDYATCRNPDALHHFPGEFFSYRRMMNLDHCPHLKTPMKLQERKNIRKKYGKNSPFAKSMIDGSFQASADGNNIYSENDLKRLKDAMLKNNTPLPGDVRAGGDISGGGDKQVLMIRAGTEILLIDEHEEDSDIEQAEYWVALLKDLGIQPHQFTIDGGGLGSTVANYMEMRLKFKGINRFMANNLPTYDFEFQDRYTEIHWYVKELLAYGCLVLPWNDTLITQARDRRYVGMTVGVKVKTEPKKAHRAEFKYSPDHLDSMIYTFSDFPIHRIRRGMALPDRRSSAGQDVDENEPTPMERKALQDSTKGNSFSGLQKMPDLSTIRRRSM